MYTFGAKNTVKRKKIEEFLITGQICISWMERSEHIAQKWKKINVGYMATWHMVEFNELATIQPYTVCMLLVVLNMFLCKKNMKNKFNTRMNCFKCMNKKNSTGKKIASFFMRGVWLAYIYNEADQVFETRLYRNCLNPFNIDNRKKCTLFYLNSWNGQKCISLRITCGSGWVYHKWLVLFHFSQFIILFVFFS